MSSNLDSNGITLIVCTHNRADLLFKLLDSIDAARPCESPVDVLIIANNCKDETESLLEARVRSRPVGSLKLSWRAEPTPGKSNALNHALRVAQGDWFAFIDDDQRLDEAFLVALDRAVRANSEVELLCGQLLPDWTGDEPAWVHDQGRFRIYPLPVPHYYLGDTGTDIGRDGPLPSGGNLIVRRDATARVGPFATHLGPVGHNLAGAEDMEWLTRAFNAGLRLRYEPTIIQRHYVDLDRLRMSYLLRLTYTRTADSIAILPGARSKGVPLWVIRKLLGYALRAATSWTAAARRFYLMRCAAALGEVRGYSKGMR